MKRNERNAVFKQSPMKSKYCETVLKKMLGCSLRYSPGLMFLIVSEFLTGLFFTGLVLLVAGSWKSFVGR